VTAAAERCRYSVCMYVHIPRGNYYRLKIAKGPRGPGSADLLFLSDFLNCAGARTRADVFVT